MPQLDPKLGEIYRYYQGGMVQIAAFATHTETGERLVVYQELFGRFERYATPYGRFVGEVDFKKHPTCPDRFRFTFVPGESLRETTAARLAENAETTVSPKIMVSQETTTFENPPEPAEQSKVTIPTDASEPVASGKPVPARTAPPPERSLSELMLAFLDERDFEKKDDILAEMASRPDLNDGMIDNLAAALDVVIDDAPIDKRFSQLRYCVQTRARFENSRLR